MQANPGKNLSREFDGVVYERLPIKTRTVFPHDLLEEIIQEYAGPIVHTGDVLFVTEKIVAITQGRSFLLEEIRARRLASFLSRYVVKTPHGIGLGMPETMEMALRECGTARILFAAAVSVVSKKLLRRSGDFYRIAGEKARAIDGPTEGTIPPYDRSVVLGPLYPNRVAQHLKQLLGGNIDVLIVDINDIGGNILGTTRSPDENPKWVEILKDNPLGQESQSTPLGIIREVKSQ